MSAENPTPPPEGKTVELDTYSRALNVYHKTNNSKAAKFDIDTDRDELTISYQGPVVVPGTLFVGPDRVDVFDRFLELKANIEDEAGYNASARSAIQAAVDLEVSRAKAAEKKVADDLLQETLYRGGGELALSNAIAAEKSRAMGVEASIRSDIAAEKLIQDGENATHSSTLSDHTVFIETNTTAISDEAKRAYDEEQAIRTLITNNAGSASGDVSVVAADLAQEVLDRASELSSLETRFEEAAALESTRVNDAITEEKKRAEGAEDALNVRINNVLSNIDPLIIDSFSEVVTALNAAGGDITNGLNTEREQREGADTAIQARLDVIEAMLQALQAQ